MSEIASAGPTRTGIADTRLEALCEGVIEAGWLAALATVPLFFNPYSRQTFEPDKALLLRIIVLTMAAAWLIKIGGGGRAAVGGGSAAISGAVQGSGRAWRIPLVLPSLFVLLSMVVSGAVSIAPWLSFAGSYPRAQGVWMALACGAFFALVLAHLRTAEQWRRILYVITLTSFAVASYAGLQRLRLDPVPWVMRSLRVGSTLGNPIFLAAFLGLVLFITVREVARRGAPLLRRGGRAAALAADLPTAVILLYNLILQILAIGLSQSRGPMLGMLTGSFLGSLALLLHAAARARVAPPARGRWLHAWAWLILIGISFATLATLWAASRPGTRLTLKTLPQIGRLAAPFQIEQGTAQTRFWTWQGGLDALEDRRPLTPESSLGFTARTLLGYGPEMFRYPFARHHPPELARFEMPDSIPDRAHNEVLDRLVNTGAIGLLGWFCWYGTIFFLAVTGLFPGGRRRAVLYWSIVTVGAVIGAALPVVLGAPRFAFFGLPVGMLAGVAVVLGVLSWSGGDGAATTTAWTARNGLIAALLATFAAHTVETNLGIEVTATKLYVWFFAALLVAAQRGWLEMEEPASLPAQHDAPARPAIAAGLLAALVVATVAFPLLANPAGSTSALSVLAGNLLYRFDVTQMKGALWLPIVVWVAAAGAAASLGGQSKSVRSGSGRVFAVTSLATSGAYLLVQAHRLARTTEMRTDGRPVLETLEHIANHANSYLCFIPLWMLACGAVLGWRRDVVRRALCRRPRAAAATAVLVAAVMALPLTASLRQLRADALIKQGLTLSAAGQHDAALVVLRHGATLAPRQSAFELELGGALVAAARAAAPGPARQAFLAEARTRLEHARELVPFDPDHTANLARLAASEAQLAPDFETRRSSLARAAAEYEHSLELRPGWIAALVEYAVVEQSRGYRERCFELLARAVELDPLSLRVQQTLAHVHTIEALLANAEGDREGELEHRAIAAAAIESTQWTDPQGLRVRPPPRSSTSAPARQVEDGDTHQQ